MILTRTTVRSAKSLWSWVKPHYSSLAQTTTAPYRNITTSWEYVKFGNASGKQAEYNDTSLLEPFIGRWTEKKSKNLKEYYTKLEYSQEIIKRYLRSKTWISFSREDDKWKYMSGYVDKDGGEEFYFKLGEEFSFPATGPSSLKILITMEGKVMNERQQSATVPDYVINITREVQGKKLIARHTYKDVTMKKTYTKSKKH